LLLGRFVRAGDRRWLFGPFAVRGGVDLTLATSAATIWRTFDGIDDSVLDVLRAARAQARARVWAAGATPDEVVFDVDRREVNLDLPVDEIAARVEAYEPPPARYTTGVLAKYARHVGSAAEGALTS